MVGGWCVEEGLAACRVYWSGWVRCLAHNLSPTTPGIHVVPGQLLSIGVEFLPTSADVVSAASWCSTRRPA
jgi:hypothetical protein